MTRYKELKMEEETFNMLETDYKHFLHTAEWSVLKNNNRLPTLVPMSIRFQERQGHLEAKNKILIFSSAELATGQRTLQ